jgi:hypothetical protein
MASPYTAYFAGMGTVVAALAIGFSTAVMMTSPLPSQKEQPTGLQKPAEARTEKPAEPVRTTEAPAAAPAVAASDLPMSPLITAAQTPPSQTPALWPVEPSTTGQASGDAKLAPEPGMIQTPVRPAGPVQASAPASTPAPVQPAAESEKVIPPSSIPTASTPPVQQTTRSRETVRSSQREAVRNPETTGSIDPVTGEWKKKEKRDGTAQKKQRRPIEQARPAQDDDESDVVVIERSPTSGYSSEPRSPLGIFDFLTGGSR